MVCNGALPTGIRDGLAGLSMGYLTIWLLPWSWASSLAVGQRMDVSALGPDNVG
jgi:hypothetical protein